MEGWRIIYSALDIAKQMFSASINSLPCGDERASSTWSAAQALPILRERGALPDGII
jgi:hypothetical protein